MGKFIKALKNVGKAFTGKEPTGKYVNDVLNSIASNGGGLLLEVADVCAMTSEQLTALQCGATVIKNENGNKHAYVVSYKEEGVGICLTYTDCENVETVSYDCAEGVWTFNSKDVTHIAQA